MNRGDAEYEFREGLRKILTEIERQQATDAPNPYAGAGDQQFHEHDTRVFFFDRFFKLLGWELGLGGNVAEEARIKADTTKFVDYVGVKGDTRAPALILEAKAWDKPSITGKGKWRSWDERDLIVRAIEHINSGGAKDTAPVTGEWHDYLVQLAGYVRMFKTQHAHDVPCAVLSSGKWLLIFKTPVATFCDGEVNNQQFYLFGSHEYVENAHTIFEEMSRVALADTAPVWMRPAQLGNYVNAENFKAAYHALLIHYEKSGVPLFAQQPRILVYPSMVVERDDHALFTVIQAPSPLAIGLSRRSEGDEDNERDTLAPHLEVVAAAAEGVRQSCAAELGFEVEPRTLDDFPGFPSSSVMAPSGLALGRVDKIVVRAIRAEPNTWLAVTGRQTHYLHETPLLECRFHSWAACHDVDHSIGLSAINSPSTDPPRAFFVDTQLHHCAHQVVQDRRRDRCHIMPIDSRTCCKACAYQEICWPPAEAAALPCGT